MPKQYLPCFQPLMIELENYRITIISADFKKGTAYLYLSSSSRKSIALKIPYDIDTEGRDVLTKRANDLAQEIKLEDKMKLLNQLSTRYNNSRSPKYRNFFEDYEHILSLVLSPFVKVKELEKFLRDYDAARSDERIVFPHVDKYGRVDLSKFTKIYKTEIPIPLKKPEITGVARVNKITKKIIREAHFAACEDEMANQRGAKFLAKIIAQENVENLFSESFSDRDRENLRKTIERLTEEAKRK